MNRKIVVKSDASFGPNKGTAIAYEAVIYDEDGSYETKQDSKYMDTHTKSTTAETIATIYAVAEMYQEVAGESEDYEIAIRSDCEYSIQKLKRQRGIGEVTDKFVTFFENNFRLFNPQWISRENNTRADALARTALERGSNGY